MSRVILDLNELTDFNFMSAPDTLDVAVPGTDRSFTMVTKMLNNDEFTVGDKLFAIYDKAAGTYAFTQWIGSEGQFPNDYTALLNNVKKTRRADTLIIAPLIVTHWDAATRKLTAVVAGTNKVWIMSINEDGCLDIHSK